MEGGNFPTPHPFPFCAFAFSWLQKITQFISLTRLPPASIKMHLAPLRSARCSVVGHAKAAELLLTGRTFTGEEAKQINLANTLVPSPDLVLPKAIELASSIAGNSPVAIRSTIASLRIQQDEGLNAALSREALNQSICYARSDWKEGLDAVSEKRSPKFLPFSSS